MTNGAGRRLDAAACAACCAVFLSFFWLIGRRVGLGVDGPWLGFEAWEFWRGVLRLLARPSARALWAVPAPLIWYYKHGAGEVYVTLPFLWLFGPTHAALLARDGFFGAAAVAATYALGLRLYRDRAAAAGAALLLASWPAFVTFSVRGTCAGVAEVAFCAGGSWLLLCFLDEGRPAAALSGAALLGLALACRTTVAAYLAGLAVCAALNRGAVERALPRERARAARLAAGCALALLAFSVPYAVAAVRDPQHVAGMWLERLDEREDGGRNSCVLQDLGVRLEQLGRLADGTASLGVFARRPDRYRVGGWPLLALALLSAAGLALRRRLAGRRSAPVVVGAVYLALSAFSPSALRAMHLLPILPLLCLAVCGLAAQAPPGRRRAALAVLGLLTAYRTAGAAGFSWRLQSELARTGGATARVSVVEKAVWEWFSARPGTRAVVLVGGPGGPDRALRLRSRGRLPVEMFEEDLIGQPADRDAFRAAVADPSARFVVDLTRVASPAPFYHLRAQAARRRLRLEKEAVLGAPDGDPVFAVYRAVASRP